MAEGAFIYKNGLNVPYLPLWSLAHAPLTVVPKHAAQLLLFPLSIVAAVVLLWILQRLTKDVLPISSHVHFWVVALALILAARWLIRDMVECGVNLALVTLSWLAIYLWIQHRDWAGGICLGLAASLKCTPLAFLGYFLWKRQWKMAAATTMATVLFTLAPAFWMGPAQYREAMAHWWGYASRGIAERDPTRGVLGEEKVQNHSLRPALARMLVHLPQGHQLRVPDRHHVEFLNLNPEIAGQIIKAIMLALALVVAWRFRGAVAGPRRGGETVLWEAAAFSVAILLYSPITWSQHCVGVLPAAYLIVRAMVSRGRFPGWMWPLAGAYVFFVLLLNRILIGREMTLLLLSYHVYSWCFLAVLAATLKFHADAVASESGVGGRLASGKPEMIAPPMMNAGS